MIGDYEGAKVIADMVLFPPLDYPLLSPITALFLLLETVAFVQLCTKICVMLIYSCIVGQIASRGNFYVFFTISATCFPKEVD